MKYIPAYTGAKQILHKMFHEIEQSSYMGYRRSWEILVEVLAHYLGIIENPWLYSNPSLDVEVVEDKLSPLRKSAFQIEWPKYDLLSMLLGIPPKLTTPRIKEPVKPHHIIYYAKRYSTQLKRRQPTTKKSKDVMRFCSLFKGELEQYVTNARKEFLTCSGSAGGADHLGAIFEEFELAGRNNRLGQCLTPVNIVDFICMSTIGDKPITARPETVLDTLMFQCIRARTLYGNRAVPYRS